MKVKTWIPLALAVVLGLAAMKLTRDALSGGRAGAPDASFATVLVAAQDLAPGQSLTPADLSVTKVPAASVPAGTFDAPEQLANRVVQTAMVKGQVVLENGLAPTGTAAGVQGLIPPGMRAITLQVNEFSGLAGLLVPGSRVDVISVIRAEEPQDVTVARTIVQNVQVRAIGRQITAASAAAGAIGPDGRAMPATGTPEQPTTNNVTLLVTPEQAEALQLANAGGLPHLVLRNANDHEAVQSEGVRMADLRGNGVGQDEPTRMTAVPTADPFVPVTPVADAPAAAEPPKTRTVTFIRATREEAVQVELPPEPPTNWQTTEVETGEATR